jgi:hypothetical protein
MEFALQDHNCVTIAKRDIDNFHIAAVQNTSAILVQDDFERCSQVSGCVRGIGFVSVSWRKEMSRKYSSFRDGIFRRMHEVEINNPL